MRSNFDICNWKKIGLSSKRTYKDDPKGWEICFPLRKQVHPTSSIKQEIKSLELDLQVYTKTFMGSKLVVLSGC